MKVGPVILGDAKGWGTWGVLTAATGFALGATAAAVVGVPLLAFMGFTSAVAGDPMFQLSPGTGKR